MSKNLKTFLIVVSVFAALVLLCVLLSMRQVKNYSDKYADTDLTKDVVGLERTGTYNGYLSEHEGATEPQKEIDVDLFSGDFVGNVSTYTDFHGVSKCLFTDIDSVVTYKINVPESGFYNVYMEYLITESRGVPAERAFYVNGELPFDDALNLTFSRIWKDAGPKKIDNQGNEIRPSQVEEYDWQSAYFSDKLGYQMDPFKFYFEKGENTITINATNEPMALKKLAVVPVMHKDNYATYLSKQPQNVTSTGEYIQIVQGEESTYRSESSLYAKYDRSSPTTQPNSVTTTVLNYVGGDAWKTTGQWIEWEFEVPSDGYYNIMVKGRQNYQRGSVSNRKIYIDGEVPFEEMQEISFEYSNDWVCKDIADADGNAYNFYLTKGTHTIRLEATLGGMGEILSSLEASTYRLNQIYRKILVYTGANPDKYREYRIDSNYPEIMEALDLEYKRLYKIVDDMVAYSGQKADQIATAQTVANQIERFCKKPQKITVEFTTFKDNITSLGTAQLNMSEAKLDIDYIAISGTDAKVKHEKSNFFTKAWHETKSFVASFFVDYNSVGNVYDKNADDVIKVWVLTGRDQGVILKTMIDDDFIPNTGIKVNVEVISQDALLNAVLAGRGPNVVLSVGSNIPVDYALRKASEDITQFPDYKEVLSHYSPSTYEQYRLDDHIYGVPETQTFCVMFYRKDVLEELGLEVPNTWKEFIELLPTIQGNNLSVGIPTAAGSASSGAATTAIMSNMPDLNMYFSLLFQYGGDMYNEAGNKTTVDTEAGIKAFDDYVKYFNDYGLPVIYDFVSRFRSGEMPIGISPYSTYNTLMVSAPEIRGLWDFTLIPGTPVTDENGKQVYDENGDPVIDRSDFVAGAATMMIATDDEKVK